MMTVTFEAQVENGQVRQPESLAPFEGQKVQVTVTAPSKSAPPDRAEEGDEPLPEGLDVERDVYVKMPLPGEILRDAVVVEGGRMQPTLIFPEELPDA
jgi:hypothetical protein